MANQLHFDDATVSLDGVKAGVLFFLLCVMLVRIMCEAVSYGSFPRYQTW